MKRFHENEELRVGELWRADLSRYVYQWTEFSKRHYVYASDIDSLRRKEERIKSRIERIKGNIDATISLDTMYIIWCDEKRGIRDTTFEGYKSTYRRYILGTGIGRKMLVDLKKPMMRQYYLSLLDSKEATVNVIAAIQQVVHQILQLAVDYDYIQKNPSDSLLRDIYRITNFQKHRRIALTLDEQKIFIDELSQESIVWKTIFLMFLTTGMRVSELVGLLWSNIDFEANTITIDHSLVYYKHTDGCCDFEINSTKTVAGNRTIPMMGVLKEILLKYRTYARKHHLTCKEPINGVSNFVFVNDTFRPFNQQNLNRFLKKIISRHNTDEIHKSEADGTVPQYLPNFSCHCLRHTFATRFCEYDPNYKKLQYILGQRDIQTTLNLYAHGSCQGIKTSMDYLEEKLDFKGL